MNFDAAIIGSGPNGLAAAIRLQQAGLATIVAEQASTPGGSVRTEELTEPGFLHDVCSSIHPLAYDSPFFKTLKLDNYGLEWIFPEIPFAHPFDDGDALACYQDVWPTAAQLGIDEKIYYKIFESLEKDWPLISSDVLSPFSFPQHPILLAKFGIKAIRSARSFIKSNFDSEKAGTFFYGAAAHSTLPLEYSGTAAFGLVLMTSAHYSGWPFPKGGAERIIDSLVRYYRSIGGKILTNAPITHLDDLPPVKNYIFDITPKQLLKIGGTDFGSRYRRRLENYRYGAGVFKIDWALHSPIPWTNEKCRKAGTIHIGFSTKEIEASEKLMYNNRISEKPYVLMAQHSIFDPTRAPEGKHTAWGYCHVPHGDITNMTKQIESQIERAAPGFKERIITRSVKNTAQMEVFNPNLVGGDINGGMQHIWQLFTRPVISLSPYNTPDKRVFICSSSTPPGGGVHGMCGYNAADAVLKKLTL